MVNSYQPPPCPPPPKLPQGWKAVYDENQFEYFFVNTITSATQWELPTQVVYHPPEDLVIVDKLAEYHTTTKACTTTTSWAMMGCWTIRTLTSPIALPWYFKTFFESSQTFAGAYLDFAPGLLEAAQAATPPSITFFKNLPSPAPEARRAIHGVYVLVLEKDGELPELYGGSSTGSSHGLWGRWIAYEDSRLYEPDGTLKAKFEGFIPVRVEDALRRGFRITHKGLLCKALKPVGGGTLANRVLFLLLESFFLQHFWLFDRKHTKFRYILRLCPWPDNFLRRRGATRHAPASSLWETPYGLSPGLSVREMEAAETLRVSGLAEDSRLTTARCREKHPGRSNSMRQDIRTENVAAEKYVCCGKAWMDMPAFDRHQKTEYHRQVQAGEIEANPDKLPATTDAAIKSRKQHAAFSDEEKYYWSRRTRDRETVGRRIKAMQKTPEWLRADAATQEAMNFDSERKTVEDLIKLGKHHTLLDHHSKVRHTKRTKM